ncbi:MAG: hypothetical protein ACK5O2_14055 [Microthrixaceae bacterium]
MSDAGEVAEGGGWGTKFHNESVRTGVDPVVRSCELVGVAADQVLDDLEEFDP